MGGLPVLVDVIAHCIHKVGNFDGGRRIVFHTSYFHRPVTQLASAIVDLINRQPLKFTQQRECQLQYSTLPFLGVVEDGHELNRAVADFQVAFFLQPCDRWVLP
jgi:hypothetical protein